MRSYWYCVHTVDVVCTHALPFGFLCSFPTHPLLRARDDKHRFINSSGWPVAKFPWLPQTSCSLLPSTSFAVGHLVTNQVLTSYNCIILRLWCWFYPLFVLSVASVSWRPAEWHEEPSSKAQAIFFLWVCAENHQDLLEGKRGTYLSKWVSSLLEHWIDMKMVMGLNSLLVFEEAMVLWESDTW